MDVDVWVLWGGMQMIMTSRFPVPRFRVDFFVCALTCVCMSIHPHTHTPPNPHQLITPSPPPLSQLHRVRPAQVPSALPHGQAQPQVCEMCDDVMTGGEGGREGNPRERE
jgi:hypothetical protein